MAGGNSLEGREQKKGIAVNTLYTMGGLLFMNAVLQIVITPLLNRMMGAEQLGGLVHYRTCCDHMSVYRAGSE